MTVRPSTIARGVAVAMLLTVIAGAVGQGAILTSILDPAAPGAVLAAATDHAGTYRLAVVLLTVEMIFQLAAVTLWHRLMRPAGPGLAVLALALGIVGTAIKAASRTGLIAPLAMVEHDLLSQGFDQSQRAELATGAVAFGDIAAGIGIMFLGASTVAFAVLMFRSGYVPRWLAVVVGASASGWLLFADPILGPALFIPISMAGLVGALALIVRLLGWGVDDAAWAGREAALYRAPAADARP
ncbi:MAG: hypothetical protein CVT64_03040 [Actinobacteria bacterium HGW-Actinobacteria-4]|nr:MAG: hypothetical protein CVT64_03040 [Actinobacteria bacterium HGW-Actinobacteria-4]